MRGLRHPSRRRLLVVAAVMAAALSGCGTGYEPTALPTTPTPSASTPGAAATPVQCDNATQSYTALKSLPTRGDITDDAMSEIIKRGRIRVGVSADTFLFGARNPFSGKIEGFDIDIARAVARKLFGDADRLQFVVLTAADRIPALEEGEVDLVARTMTMTCDRWTQIAFSSEYYRAGQKVLVTQDNEAETLEDLVGKRVCAPTGTSSLAKLKTFEGVVPVTSTNHTGCLVLLQQGQADAITGDDTVLAGLAAQDPYARVTDAPAITDEPYGLGIKAENVYFVRYVNAVLHDLRSSGEWTAIYDRWLAEPLGPAPKPPTAVYGR